METKDRLEQIIYAAVGAGDLWAERATEFADDEKRSKRVENLAKRGHKRIDKATRGIGKQRKEINKQRKEFQSRVDEALNEQFSLPQLEEVLEEVQKAIEPIAERLGLELPDLASRAKARTARKPAAKKSAAKKPATRKPAAKKPATRKPAAKKPATRKPAAKKPATKSATD